MPSVVDSSTPNSAALTAKLRERPSVRDRGAKGDGEAWDAAAIQDALNSFDSVWVPPGLYLIDRPLELPSYRSIAFASDAIFCPVEDGMTVFRTGPVSYSSRVIAPRIHARGRRGVTAFDLEGFRHRAEISHADILGCERGIVLRELCWDTVLHMPWIRQTRRAIIVANGSNAVDIVHPGIDGCDIGIGIEAGPAHSTTSTRVWGGYVQNGRCGIVDSGGIGTIVDGTYFEGFSEADIQLSRSVRTNLSRTQHYGEVGEVAIQMVAADGATVLDPTMASGARRIGLYDMDETSRSVVRFDTSAAEGMNAPIGNVGRSGVLVHERTGTFAPVLAGQDAAIRYERQEGRWRRAGAQLSVAVELRWSAARPGGAIVVNGLPDFPGLQPTAAVSPATLEGETLAQVRLTAQGGLRVMRFANGAEVPAAMGASGAVTISLTCLV